MELQVLMVDDHAPIIEGYKSILAFNSEGHILKTTEAHSCEMGYNAIVNAEGSFDLIFLDLTLPPYPEKNLHSGEDLVFIAKKYHPKAKIVLLTSHSESIVLFKVANDKNLDGVLVKSDFRSHDLLEAFEIIVKGGTYFSPTIINHKKIWEEKSKFLDSYNRQILLLLSQGVKTKSLPDILHLSKSAIDKRKSFIKQFFGIDKGTDEDILNEARRQGLL